MVTSASGGAPAARRAIISLALATARRSPVRLLASRGCSAPGRRCSTGKMIAMGRPTPRDRQHEVVYMPPRGHHVILGTAGTGKTVMAVHRAFYLARPGGENGGSATPCQRRCAGNVTWTRSSSSRKRHVEMCAEHPSERETRRRPGCICSQGLRICGGSRSESRSSVVEPLSNW